MKEKKLVSVIVPVYNGADYVGKLIQSFLDQTYQSFELILINDGSTDNSLEILQEFQERNSDKIVVYTQKNQGIARTRNRGIQYASGFYIMFADNDDYVQPDYIETLVQAIEKQDADMVICSCRKVDPDGNTLYEQVMDQTEWSKFRMIAPWARIIRRDFVLSNHLEFGDFKVGEDVFFTVTAYNLSDKIEAIPYIGYNWVQRYTSVSNTVQKTVVASPIPMLDALVKRNKKLIYIPEDVFTYFVTKLLVWNLYYICGSLDKKEMRRYCDKYFTWLYQTFPHYRSNPLVSFRKPEGELLGIRCLVAVFVKMPMSRLMILRILKLMKRVMKMR